MVRHSLLAFPKIEGGYVRYRLRIPYYKLRLEQGGLKISFKGLLKPDKKILVSFVRIGITPTISQFFESSSYYIFMNLVSRYGSSVVAAFGIGGKISGIVNLPLLGVNQAASALVGQNLGAGKPERSEKTAWYSAVIGVCLGSVMTLLAFFFTKQIFGIFNSDLAVIAVGIVGFTYAMIGNTINVVSWMLSSVFDGSGYTMWPSIWGQINTWLFSVLPVYIAVVVFDTGYVWVFYIGIFHSIIHLLTTFYFVRAGAWKKARI
jgi:Na+-driven multidrug efflux pump